jgi:thiamine monophosphate kinase
MEGIRRVLKKADCFMCGGDMGRADPWRYCGLAMGPVISKNPLTHRFPLESQNLWVTGLLGDANIAALQKTVTPEFELRLREAEIIRKSATACIDTSSGFFDAVWILNEQNPHMQLEIDLNSIPFAEGVVKISSISGFLPEAALLGGAGEYELLFAVPEDQPAEELLSAGMTLVGTARKKDDKGVKLKCRDGSTKTMLQPPPCPRETSNIEGYIQNVIDMSFSLFG